MQQCLFRLTPAGCSWLSPVPDGWHLWHRTVGLIPWVSKLWPVVAGLLYILQCLSPCRCTKIVIWKIPIWCLTFLVYPRCVLHWRADQSYMRQPVLPTWWRLVTADTPTPTQSHPHPHNHNHTHTNFFALFSSLEINAKVSNHGCMIFLFWKWRD